MFNQVRELLAGSCRPARSWKASVVVAWSKIAGRTKTGRVTACTGRERASNVPSRRAEIRREYRAALSDALEQGKALVIELDPCDKPLTVRRKGNRILAYRRFDDESARASHQAQILTMISIQLEPRRCVVSQDPALETTSSRFSESPFRVPVTHALADVKVTH